MSLPALPTNRDENWRHANLRALAKARADAAPVAPADPSQRACRPPLPAFERWVFVDGRCSDSPASSGTMASHSRLLDAREAGNAFAALLDSDLATAGIDFALARINAARGDEVLHIELPDDAPATNIELIFLARAAGAAGTSYPRVQLHAGRNARLHLVERHLSLDDAGCGG